VGVVLNAVYNSPIGRLLVTGTEEAVVAVSFEPFDRPARSAARGAARDAVIQLEEYFAGERTRFELTLRPRGTPFFHTVWSRLLEVPYGTTVSYSELARRAGSPHAVRAVGSANARNPLAIIVPCHRVVGRDGGLRGYGGGIDKKRWLLDHEGAEWRAAR
jgi:methylated-DNA-[protein]-cysteine S-methyltransferase